MRLQPFDIVFVQGRSFISNAIRWATRVPGEPPTQVSHVAFVVYGDWLYGAVVQEALIDGPRQVVRHPLGVYAGTGELVAVYRPLNLTDHDIVRMAEQADRTVGKGYNIGAIGLQLVDALLSKIVRRPVRFARRLALSKWQICSQNVADVWNAAGLSFGVEPGTASPDDIYDFVTSSPDKYKLIRPLSPLPIVTLAAP